MHWWAGLTAEIRPFYCWIAMIADTAASLWHGNRLALSCLAAMAPVGWLQVSSSSGGIQTLPSTAVGVLRCEAGEQRAGGHRNQRGPFQMGPVFFLSEGAAVKVV